MYLKILHQHPTALRPAVHPALPQYNYPNGPITFSSMSPLHLSPLVGIVLLPTKHHLGNSLGILCPRLLCYIPQPLDRGEEVNPPHDALG